MICKSVYPAPRIACRSAASGNGCTILTRAVFSPRSTLAHTPFSSFRAFSTRTAQWPQVCGIGVVRFIPIRNAAFDWTHCTGTAAPAPPQGFAIPPDAKAAHRQGQPDKNNFHWVPPQADKSIIPTATGRSGSEAPPCAGTGRSPPSAPAESLAAPPFRPSAPRCDPPRPRCASGGR